MAAVSLQKITYLESLMREGDEQSYFAWLRRVREEETANKAALPISTRDDASCNLTEHSGRLDISNGHGVPAAMRTAGGSSIALRRVRRRQRPNTKARQITIHERISHVSDAWDNFQDSGARDGIYVFLTSAYGLVMHYRGQGRTRRLLRRASKFAGLAYDKHGDPFTTVIRCTCEHNLDSKTISKWARALRYAAYRMRAPRQLKTFIKALGGINACADCYAKRLGRRSRGGRSTLDPA